VRLEGARVLVTGSDGFIGSHLVERLQAEGADVRAFCFYNSNGSFGWLDDLDEKARSALDLRLGDIRDAGAVDAATEGVDIVLHLAALIAIPYSYVSPASFIETNVNGTFNVLEAARRHRVARVVHTSTSEVYGTPDVVPITEDHPLKGQSPYSASKIAADKLCEAWACSFDVPVVVLRPFNTYGPRQSARAVIPTILSQLLAGHQPLRLGSLRPRRDFTYVGDTVEGFVKAACADLEAGQVVQLGTGTDVSIGELVGVASRLLGIEVEVQEEEERLRPERSEVQVLRSDPSRAAALLGWRARTDLDEGLAQTLEWFKVRVDPDRALRYQR
jgi:UDP-glucose 4-epimerase